MESSFVFFFCSCQKVMKLKQDKKIDTQITIITLTGHISESRSKKVTQTKVNLMGWVSG